jgi:hypothetical protein
MKNSDSFPGCFDRLIAGIIAPNKFPRCGRPLLWMPVKIRAMVQRKQIVDKIQAQWLSSCSKNRNPE